jgi:hypothetical protein
VPTLTNPIEIKKRFLEAIHFYQKYFQKFTNKTTLMRNLKKKDEPFIWNETFEQFNEWMKTSIPFY